MEKIIEKKKKKKKEPYFGPTVQAAIIEYNATDDYNIKNQIFSRVINPAFKKLSEVQVHMGKFYKLNDTVRETQNEVIAHLLEKLPNYNPESGKAFSYFTIVSRHYLINQDKKRYADLIKRNSSTTYQFVSENEDVDNPNSKLIFFDKFVDYLEYNLKKIFPKENDFCIANAILTIIKRRDNLENFNKKALHLYIKEMTDGKSQQITKVINILKSIFRGVYVIYHDTNEIDFNHIPSKHKKLKKTKKYGLQ